MGYRVVTVSPLKQFPIASFGLANVVSLDDAKEQISAAAKKAAAAEIDALEVAVPFKRDAEIHADHSAWAKAEISRLEERWPKIGLALEIHLERQKRRQAHFESACRLEWCDNPRRQKRGSGGERGTKARRPGIHPLFCGAHAWLRRSLTKEALDALHAKSANRVRLTD